LTQFDGAVIKTLNLSYPQSKPLSLLRRASLGQEQLHSLTQMCKLKALPPVGSCLDLYLKSFCQVPIGMRSGSEIASLLRD
jgi:hypothetical protein